MKPPCNPEKDFLVINLKAFPQNDFVEVLWYEKAWLYRKNKHTLILSRKELIKDEKGNIKFKEEAKQ